MKYPLDKETFTRGYITVVNSNNEEFVEAIVKLINKAYQQGLLDGKFAKD